MVNTSPLRTTFTLRVFDKWPLGVKYILRNWHVDNLIKRSPKSLWSFFFWHAVYRVDQWQNKAKIRFLTPHNIGSGVKTKLQLDYFNEASPTYHGHDKKIRNVYSQKVSVWRHVTLLTRQIFFVCETVREGVCYVTPGTPVHLNETHTQTPFSESYVVIYLIPMTQFQQPVIFYRLTLFFLVLALQNPCYTIVYRYITVMLSAYRYVMVIPPLYLQLTLYIWYSKQL